MKPKRQAAFSLVEVTLAIGIAAFCLIALLGLLDTGLIGEKATLGQTAAASVVAAVYGDLAAAPSGSSSSRLFGFSLAGSDPATPQTVYLSETAEPTGPVGSAPSADSRYRVSVGLRAPARGEAAPTLVRILVTWPAAADPLPGQWPAKRSASGSVEVVTALDRP